MAQLLSEDASFAFETTLASKSILKLIKKAHDAGYAIELIYIALPDVALARRRVAKRVAAGGHDIPGDVIERRFARSLDNLINRYIDAVDEWRVYDNASTEKPLLICRGRGKTIDVIEDDKWQRLLKLSASLARR